MFSSFALVATVFFVAGTVIIVALLGRSRTDDSIARVLYDTEHPKKTQ